MSLFKLKPLDKYHILIAVAIGVWLTALLILIAPFDIAELPFKARLEILPVYGLISFVGYLVLIPFQNWAYEKMSGQPVYFEVLIIVLFNLLVLIGSYAYYKSGIVNGDYTFVGFTLGIYYPVFFILLPVIVFGRWFIRKKIIHQNSEKIVLTGDNKLDILQIKEEDLISISSADNYVTVAYLRNDVVAKKLLRTTLKNINSQLPQLLKVHRSHLINPIHLKEWKNPNTLVLTQMEVPVSKNYKKDIVALDLSSLKKHGSPQSQ